MTVKKEITALLTIYCIGPFTIFSLNIIDAMIDYMLCDR